MKLMDWRARLRTASFNPIGGIAGRVVGRWIPRTSQGLTVLSIDGRWLKLLHAAGRTSHRTVTALLAHPVEGLSDDDILSWLRQACKAKGIETGSVLVANPSHLTTARLFTLPSVDLAEIRDIVELQAEKHIPYAKEEILTDFQIVESDRTGYSRVLLVISHQDIVHRSLKLVDGVGWPLERVGFELEGLVNWFRIVRSGAPAEGVLVADVDRETTTLAVFQQGRLSFHRSLSIGSSHVTQDAAEGVTKLIAEFQRSLELCEAEGLAVAVSEILLTGHAERIPGLKERVQQELGHRTTVVSPFERCPLANPALAQDEAASQVSFASLLGVALGTSEIDLTPKALRLHRAFEIRSRALVGLGCQLIAGLILVSCLVVGKAYKSERLHARLLHEHEVAAGAASELEQDLARLDLVKKWVTGRGQLLEAMLELGHQTPPAIQWDAVTYVKGEQVVLKGVSQEMPKVFDFVAGLKASPRFTNVEAKRVTKRKEGAEDITEFEVVCSL